MVLGSEEEFSTKSARKRLNAPRSRGSMDDLRNQLTPLQSADDLRNQLTSSHNVVHSREEEESVYNIDDNFGDT